MKYIFRLAGYLTNFIIPHRFVIYVQAAFNHFYTGYNSKRLKYLGRNSIINYPLNMNGSKYISIGKNVSVGKRACITAWDSNQKYPNQVFIEIADNVVIGDDCHITASNKILIGADVLIGKKVTITDNSHGFCDNLNEHNVPPIRRDIYSKGSVVIHERVWIGDKVTILSGVTIGAGAIIGANSVVTKNICANSIVAGIPAQVIKK